MIPLEVKTMIQVDKDTLLSVLDGMQDNLATLRNLIVNSPDVPEPQALDMPSMLRKMAEEMEAGGHSAAQPEPEPEQLFSQEPLDDPHPELPRALDGDYALAMDRPTARSINQAVLEEEGSKSNPDTARVQKYQQHLAGLPN